MIQQEKSNLNDSIGTQDLIYSELNDSPSPQPSTSNTSINSQTLESRDDQEMRLLHLRMGGGIRHIPQLPSEDDLLKTALLSYLNEKKITDYKEEFNLLDYWQSRRFESPLLYKLAQVALSVPPTQVEVERMFSALVLILSHLRNRLSREVLDAIMILKMNLDLIKCIDFSDF